MCWVRTFAPRAAIPWGDSDNKDEVAGATFGQKKYLEWGFKDAEGNYIYDNLPEYEYVDVNYDTYRYFPYSLYYQILTTLCTFIFSIKNTSTISTLRHFNDTIDWHLNIL